MKMMLKMICPSFGWVMITISVISQVDKRETKQRPGKHSEATARNPNREDFYHEIMIIVRLMIFLKVMLKMFPRIVMRTRALRWSNCHNWRHFTREGDS